MTEGVKKFRFQGIAAFVILVHATFACRVAGAEELSFRLKSGRLIRATVRVPKAVPRQNRPGPAGKLPAILLFGGFQEAAHVLNLVHTKEPAILASFDYPFDPPRKFIFPESLKYAPALKATMHETSEGIETLYALLRKRPDVDPDRMSIVGASVGAPFAVIAAEQARIPGLVIVHGFGKIRLTAEHQFVRKWEPKYGALSRIPAWLLTTLAAIYLDVPSPEASAENLRASQKVLMISATEDSFIPKAASESLWESVRGSPAESLRIQMEGDHLQPGSDALIEKILGQVTAWMKSVNLL
jgi:dienelactone hydrolase